MAVRQEQRNVFDTSVVSSGMDVYDNHGEKMGIVAEVWIEVQDFGYIAKSHFDLADYGPVAGTGALLRGSDGYVQVRQENGARYEDENDLFIPLQQVQDVDGDRSLVAEQDGAYWAYFRRAPGPRLK